MKYLPITIITLTFVISIIIYQNKKIINSATTLLDSVVVYNNKIKEDVFEPTDIIEIKKDTIISIIIKKPKKEIKSDTIQSITISDTNKIIEVPEEPIKEKEDTIIIKTIIDTTNNIHEKKKKKRKKFLFFNIK